MTENHPPKRRSRVGRIVFWSILGLLLGAIAFLVIWKWNTLGYLVNSDSIGIKEREEITEALAGEGYNVYHNEGDELAYRVLEDAIDVKLRFEGEELAAMDVNFNYNHISIRTVSEAAESAEALLSPFFSQAEIEALVVLLSAELGPRVSDNAIHCTVPLGAYTLTVDGDQKIGDVAISLIR